MEQNLDHISICACSHCAGAMLFFSVSFQFYQMSPKRNVSTGNITLYTCPVVNIQSMWGGPSCSVPHGTIRMKPGISEGSMGWMRWVRAMPLRDCCWPSQWNHGSREFILVRSKLRGHLQPWLPASQKLKQFKATKRYHRTVSSMEIVHWEWRGSAKLSNHWITCRNQE